MHLIQNTFGSNIKKTRDPKRKFAGKKYFEEIDRDTKLVDLHNGLTMNLLEAVEKYGIIDVQLIDFSGSIFLNQDWEIKSGFNSLFHSKVQDNESDLLWHSFSDKT